MSEPSESEAAHPRAEKPEFLTEKRFDAFALPGKLLSALNEAGFVYCTPIQEQTLPISLSGRDVAGQAQTGTGKTAAFLATVITRILKFTERDPHLPAALIIAPTRELSHQIYEEALTFCRLVDLRIAEVVGGVDYKRQAESLRQGTDIVICTPGRIIDYYKQGIFMSSLLSRPMPKGAGFAAISDSCVNPESSHFRLSFDPFWGNAQFSTRKSG